jgi:hypothetical protein
MRNNENIFRSLKDGNFFQIVNQLGLFSDGCNSTEMSKKQWKMDSLNWILMGKVELKTGQKSPLASNVRIMEKERMKKGDWVSKNGWTFETFS